MLPVCSQRPFYIEIKILKTDIGNPKLYNLMKKTVLTNLLNAILKLKPQFLWRKQV